MPFDPIRVVGRHQIPVFCQPPRKEVRFHGGDCRTQCLGRCLGYTNSIAVPSSSTPLARHLETTPAKLALADPHAQAYIPPN